MSKVIDAPEHMTRQGAEALANRIERYWALRGQIVRATVPDSDDDDSRGFVVRSDMLNGLPRPLPETKGA